MGGGRLLRSPARSRRAQAVNALAPADRTSVSSHTCARDSRADPGPKDAAALNRRGILWFMSVGACNGAGILAM